MINTYNDIETWAILNLPKTKSWFEMIDNPCILFYTWFMWFYNTSCTILVDLLNSRIKTSCDQNFVVNIFYTVSWTIHAVYILNRTISLEHAVFRLFLWLYWSQYRGYKWDKRKNFSSLLTDTGDNNWFTIWYTKCIYVLKNFSHFVAINCIHVCFVH